MTLMSLGDCTKMEPGNCGVLFLARDNSRSLASSSCFVGVGCLVWGWLRRVVDFALCLRRICSWVVGGFCWDDETVKERGHLGEMR